MSESIITSRDNAQVRRVRAAREGKIEDRIFIEGLRLSAEVARSGLGIDNIICTEKFAQDERGAELLAHLGRARQPLTLVSERVFSSLSDTKSPQGIVILAERPETGQSVVEQKSESRSLFVVMHQLNNPSNAGAILRTAEASGATAVVATRETTNLFAPKALRAAMGSTLRLALWTGVHFAEILSWCRGRGVRTIGADVRADRRHTEIDWTGPCALIVGSEASGLTRSETAMLDERVRIPMRAPVESLNVAVAASVLLYEAARQKAFT